MNTEQSMGTTEPVPTLIPSAATVAESAESCVTRMPNGPPAATEIVIAANPSPGPPPGPSPALPCSAKPPPIEVDPSLGTIVALSEADQMQLMGLEAAIDLSLAQGWKGFVDIGFALTQIKKGKLYTEFGTFEEYCLSKWDFKHSKANYLMAAAEAFKSIAALPDVPRPGRESSLRPLLHLKPEDVQRVWKTAVERTGGRRITARVVKNVVQSLNLAVPPLKGQPSKSEGMDRHREITDCFGQLLTLLSRRADYSSVIGKVEELHALVEGLFAKRRAA